MHETVILADDHEVVLEGMRRILEQEFEIVATVRDGRALLAAIEQWKPDVVVTDIGMPLLNGLEALRQAKHSGCTARFVFLTARLDVGLAKQAIRLGASGYVLKHAASEELVAAIRATLAGETYVAPGIAKEVFESVPVTSEDRLDYLTEREREVLQLLAEGKIIKEIATVLGISPRTVEFHKNNIVAKTGLRSVAELARYAASRGIVPELS